MPARRIPGANLPEYRPQLATLAAAAPDDDQWLHETKYDGFRMGLRIEGTDVRLLTRNGLDWSARFPTLIDAARRLRTTTALLDGEVAMLEPDGRTSFQGLQRGSSSGGTLVYVAFDLLFLDGESLVDRPLEARKDRLRALLPKRASSPLRYSTHVIGDGPRVFADACRARLEGIISKQRDQPARAGRGRTWLKVKCVARQEFVIGGFTEPQGARQGLGALLIGYHDDAGALVWAGKVGTGFTIETALALRARLDELAQEACPFTPAPRGALARAAHWVRPELVGEVSFTEWTSAGKIRHPSFQGLRGDKPARDVRRERVGEPASRRPGAVPANRPRGRVTTSARTDAKRRTGETASRSVVAGVAISNGGRVMYPDPLLTKLDLARYYERVGEWMLPHIANRPLSLVACPSGITGPCMYIKHGKAPALPALRRVAISEKTKVDEYLVLDSVEGLVSLMQMNWLEAHTWNSTTDALEQPNRLVFDLDPGPDVGWPAVVRAARSTRDALVAKGLRAWVKTSGGRGLHVVVPVVPDASWDACLSFSERVAADLVAGDPGTFTTQFAKAGREGQILVDVLRNRRGSTVVSAFSPRARPGAPVSVPLTWDDLSPRHTPDHYTVRSVPRRLGALRKDPWGDYWACVQHLPSMS